MRADICNNCGFPTEDHGDPEFQNDVACSGPIGVACEHCGGVGSVGVDGHPEYGRMGCDDCLGYGQMCLKCGTPSAVLGSDGWCAECSAIAAEEDNSDVAAEMWANDEAPF